MSGSPTSLIYPIVRGYVDNIHLFNKYPFTNLPKRNVEKYSIPFLICWLYMVRNVGFIFEMVAVKYYLSEVKLHVRPSAPITAMPALL